jgi:hypothetical protein
MTANHRTDDDLKRVIRGMALALGLLANVPFLLFLLEWGSRAWPQLSWSNPQGKPLFIVMTFAILGYALAWRWLKVGGVLAASSAITLCALVYLGAGSSLMPAALVISIPLCVAGWLFLVCDSKAFEAQP